MPLLSAPVRQVLQSELWLIRPVITTITLDFAPLFSKQQQNFAVTFIYTRRSLNAFLSIL
jgi:hypothetical protein